VAGDADVVVAHTENLACGYLHRSSEILHREPISKIEQWAEANFSGFGVCALRREVAQECPPDPEYFMAFGDLDWALQLKKKDYRIGILKLPGIVHDGGGDSRYKEIRHGKEQWEWGRERLRKKWGITEIQ